MFRRSRSVAKASVAASLDGRATRGLTRARSGVKWRYGLRETQAPSPTSDYREGRAKVHQIDSFVERVQPVDGQVGAIFLCARHPRSGIAGRRTC